MRVSKEVLSLGGGCQLWISRTLLAAQFNPLSQSFVSKISTPTWVVSGCIVSPTTIGRLISKKLMARLTTSKKLLIRSFLLLSIRPPKGFIREHTE